jgi:glycine/D-amino acid oxidase-like deaminating enzyme
MGSCDVVVVGGGCIGASVAYHLAEAGCTDVVLVESGVLGGGSTSKAAGGIRMQHGDPLNTLLARRSLDEFSSFAELTGSEIDFKQVGYLFLLDTAADLEMFAQAATMQRGLGIPVEQLSPEAARDIVPQLEIDGLIGATLCSMDGYATPEAVVQGFAAAARRRGVQVRQGTAVSRVVVEGGRVIGVDVVGVDVGGERISAPTVVCAAGTGSAAVAATAGIDLPVSALRRRIFFSPRSGGVPDGVPLTVDFSSGFYFHREGPGLVFAGREFQPEDLMAPALRRLPVLGDLPITSSWFGDYDMSPDHNGIVGGVDDVAGFYYATGFSGHGFMLSPAVGEHLAELITGQLPSIDLSAFNVRRFADMQGRRLEPIVI